MGQGRFHAQQLQRVRENASWLRAALRQNVSAVGSPERRSTVRRSGHATLAETRFLTNVTAERLKATHAPAHLRA